MNEILIFLGISFILGLGFVFIKFFNLLSDLSNIEIIPFSFGTGIGIIALQLIIYSCLAVPWNVFNLFIPWTIIFFLFLALKPKFLYGQIKFKFSFNLISLTSLLLIFSLFLYCTFEAQLRPLSAWDGWAIWLFKAKVFFVDKSINPNHTIYFENSYPHILSLIITFLYLVIGSVNDRVVLLIYPAFYIFLAGLLFFSLSRKIGTEKALLSTFLLISSQDIIRHAGQWDAGYADLPLGYFIFASVVLLEKFIKNKNMKNLILLQVFLAITSLIKNEGLPFSIIIETITIYHIFKFHKLRELYLTLIWAIPVILWTIYKNTHNFFPNYLFNKTSIHPERIFIIIFQITKEALNFQRWNLLGEFIILCFLVYLFTPKRKLISLLYLIIFLQLSVYISVFMLTPHNVIAHILNTMDRLFLHIAALSLYTSFLVIFSVGKKE